MFTMENGLPKQIYVGESLYCKLIYNGELFYSKCLNHIDLLDDAELYTVYSINMLIIIVD